MKFVAQLTKHARQSLASTKGTKMINLEIVLQNGVAHTGVVTKVEEDFLVLNLNNCETSFCTIPFDSISDYRTYGSQ